MSSGIKYPALEVQIAMRGIRKSAIAKTIGCSDRSLSNKLRGKTRFTWDEVLAMKENFFPDMTPEALMRSGE